MKTRTVIILAMLARTFVTPLQADETKQKDDLPGYRPLTEHSVAFALNVESAKIAVFPSVVRTVNPAEDNVSQEYSLSSQEQTIKLLKENGLGIPYAAVTEFDLSKAPEGKGQYALFLSGIQYIGDEAKTFNEEADYFIILDIIFVKTDAWGIQCYILDRTGTNVFSFLFNSHHKPFIDAGLNAEDASPESRKRVIAESTTLALTALKKHVVQEREIALYKPEPRHAGIYVSRDSPSDYIECRPDGSFVGMKEGRVVTGTYAVIHGSTVILSVLDTRTQSKLHIPVGELKDDTLYFRDGDIGMKIQTAPKDEFKFWIGSWDSDDDGMISQEEFLTSSKKMKAKKGKPYDTEKATKSFARLDKNKDGFITPSEEPRPQR